MEASTWHLEAAGVDPHLSSALPVDASVHLPMDSEVNPSWIYPSGGAMLHPRNPWDAIPSHSQELHSSTLPIPRDRILLLGLCRLPVYGLYWSLAKRNQSPILSFKIMAIHPLIRCAGMSV